MKERGLSFDPPGKQRNSRGEWSYELAALEDRSSPRARLKVPAKLRFRGGRDHTVYLRNLSTSGFCAITVTHGEPGSHCMLTLPGMEPLRSHVVWWDRGEMGCAFDRLLSDTVYEKLVKRYGSEDEDAEWKP